MSEQAYRYRADLWSADKARVHCEAHSGRFEQATSTRKSEESEPIIDCDHLFAFEFQKVFEDERIVAGYASFAEPDLQGDLIPIPALQEAVKEYLEAPIVWFEHQPLPAGKLIPKYQSPDGEVLETKVDDKGFYAVAKVFATEIGDIIWDLIKRKTLRGFSVRGVIFGVPVRECKEGRCYRRLDKTKIGETSFVHSPANPGSFFQFIKSLRIAEDLVTKECEECLKEIVKASDQTEREKLHQAAEQRAEKYGIGFKEGKGHLTKPSEYESLSEDQFADPVNYAYPIDEANVGAALRYFAKPENRRFYTHDEQVKIWERIVRAALRAGVVHRYDPEDPLDRALPTNLKEKMEGYKKMSNDPQNPSKPTTEEVVVKITADAAQAKASIAALTKTVEELSGKLATVEKQFQELYGNLQVSGKLVDIAGLLTTVTALQKNVNELKPMSKEDVGAITDSKILDWEKAKFEPIRKAIAEQPPSTGQKPQSLREFIGV